MAFQHVKMPEQGDKVRIENGKLVVSDQPILGFIEGDGIGVDITPACMKVWNAAVEKAYGGKRKVHWAELFLGEKAAGVYDGNYFPDETMDAIKDLVVAIKGPLTTPVGEGFRSLNVSLRQTLDLFACVRPVKWYEGVPSPLKKPHEVNAVIFRENTEDVYAGLEYRSGDPDNLKLAKFLREEMGAKFFEDAGLGIKPISPFGSQRLVRKAIQYAIEHGRESVTLVHKGNIMKFTEGAFRNWGYELAKEEFPDHTITEEELYDQYGGKRPEGKVVIKDRIADIIFQLLQLRPEEFDVLATMNLNGDYLSDAAAAEVGGIGIAPGANMADHVAVFEATHGTAPKYANLDKVNPSSLLLSGVMMLEYMGWTEAADLINAAFPLVIGDKTVTYDFARQMTGAQEVKTSEFANCLIRKIQSGRNIMQVERERRKAAEEQKAVLEAERVADPTAAMIASGRQPSCAADIMTKIKGILPPETLVTTAMHVMRESGIGSIIVQMNDGDWGILTRRDVVKKIIAANKSPGLVKVGDIASSPLVTVDRSESLLKVANLLMENDIRRVVVFDEVGMPEGIVSENGLFRNVEEFGWAPEE